MKYRPVETIKDQAVYRELLRVAQVFDSLATGPIPPTAAEPPRPKGGDSAIADGVSWNPLGDGIQQPVWYDGVTGQWRGFGGGVPPLAHTHTVPDVIGLQAALDLKADDNHTHTIAEVTGLQIALDAKASLVAVENTVMLARALSFFRAG